MGNANNMNSYCDAIQDPTLRQYAHNYARFLAGGGTKPEEPEELSPRSRMAVQTRLSDIQKGR